MPEPLAPLREILLQDDALLRSLAALEDPDQFAHELIDAARRQLPGGDPDASEASLRDAITASRAPGPPAWRLECAPPDGWLPVEVALDGEELVLEWLWFGDAALAEPFFEQSSERAARLPVNALLRCVTPLSALDRWRDAPPPAGLVLHMSRCGSTLVARMFAASGAVAVISEAPVLDSMLRLAALRAVPESAVAALAAALLRRRDGSGAPGVIKLDAWHTLQLPLLRRVFPDTPRVFLYRDPVEVLVSHARRPGMHTIPGALSLEGLGLENTGSIAPEAYPSFMLEAICRAALADRSCLLVDYRELPGACENRIAPHFGIAPDAAMNDAASEYSKAPAQDFSDDSSAKQDEATPELRVLAAQGLDAAYAALGAAQRSPPAASAAAAPAPANTSVSFRW